MHSCVKHPGTPAEFKCEMCGKMLCGGCMQKKNVARIDIDVCPECGGRAARMTEEERGIRQATFFGKLPSAFAYPVRGNGLYIIAGGVVMFAALGSMSEFFSRFYMVGGLVTLMILTFTGGFLCAYVFEIIKTTVAGRATPPDWPEFAEFHESIVTPLWSMTAAVIICFGPAVACYYFLINGRAGPPAGFDHAMAATQGLGLAGGLYFPMALLCTAMFGFSEGINPLHVLPAIFRVPASYAVACVTLGSIWFAHAFTQELSTDSGLVITLVLGAARGFASLYLLMAGSRILGLLYAANAKKIGWFGEGEG
jgi:hypothetical protein